MKYDRFTLDTDLAAVHGLDIAVDFMHAFGDDVRAACQSVPPLFENKKSAQVIPFTTRGRPAAPSPSATNQEVPSCSNVTCPNATSDA